MLIEMRILVVNYYGTWNSNFDIFRLSPYICVYFGKRTPIAWHARALTI